MTLLLGIVLGAILALVGCTDQREAPPEAERDATDLGLGLGQLLYGTLAAVVLAKNRAVFSPRRRVGPPAGSG